MSALQKPHCGASRTGEGQEWAGRFSMSDRIMHLCKIRSLRIAYTWWRAQNLKAHQRQADKLASGRDL